MAGDPAAAAALPPEDKVVAAEGALVLNSGAQKALVSKASVIREDRLSPYSL
jgi:hypothetical protein